MRWALYNLNRQLLVRQFLALCSTPITLLILPPNTETGNLQVNLLSNSTPRNLTCVAKSTDWVNKQSWESLAYSRMSMDLLKTTAFVLDIVNDNLLFLNQLVRDSRIFSVFLLAKWNVLSITMQVQSSGYNIRELVGAAITTLFTYMLKRSGLSIEPWGTPNLIPNGSDTLWPILVLSDLFSKQLLIHIMAGPWTPQEYNLLSWISWSKVLKAFDRSVRWLDRPVTPPKPYR